MSTYPTIARGACTVLLAGALLSANAETPAPEYGVREDAPSTGSAIKRYTALPASLPTNLSWEQLSPADQERFKSNYETMAPGDEPPFPIGGLRKLLAPIAKVQGKLQVTGEARFVATVDAKGEVTDVQIIGKIDPEMAQYAGQVLFLVKFKPAVCKGQPCQMQFPLDLDFALM